MTFSRPCLAIWAFLLPSKLKGMVNIPNVIIPASLAILANSGTAPDPVPPPKAVTKTHRSIPLKSLAILSFSSKAVLCPILGSMPHPKPLVIFWPKGKILAALRTLLRAWRSVLATIKSILFN